LNGVIDIGNSAFKGCTGLTSIKISEGVTTIGSSAFEGCKAVDEITIPQRLWQKQSHRLTEIVKNNEGVWLSAKLFYVVGSLSLLSIITIVLEIAFYVYFHWIL
jgi:hypothetical protein